MRCFHELRGRLTPLRRHLPRALWRVRLAPMIVWLTFTMCAPSTQVDQSRSPVVTSATATGSITGSLSYPSDFVPALVIFAQNTGAGPSYTAHTVFNQRSFTISGVRSGSYLVFAYVDDQSGRSDGGSYTTCDIAKTGGQCPDHHLLPVNVAPGAPT